MRNAFWYLHGHGHADTALMMHCHVYMYINITGTRASKNTSISWCAGRDDHRSCWNHILWWPYYGSWFLHGRCVSQRFSWFAQPISIYGDILGNDWTKETKDETVGFWPSHHHRTLTLLPFLLPAYLEPTKFYDNFLKPLHSKSDIQWGTLLSTEMMGRRYKGKNRDFFQVYQI